MERQLGADGLEAELEEPCPGTAVAAVLVALAALLLAAVPAAVALDAPILHLGWLAAGLGGVFGFILSVKLGAIAWGVAAQLWSAYPAGVVTD
ncbi:MAG: hypothetical protein PVSMB3_13240 [Candidatus Dormibacteraceae bacterium]